MKHICKRAVFWGVVLPVACIGVAAVAQDAGVPVPQVATGVHLDDVTGVTTVGLQGYIAVSAVNYLGKLVDAFGRFTDAFVRFTDAVRQLTETGLRLEDVRTHASAVLDLSSAFRERPRPPTP